MASAGSGRNKSNNTMTPQNRSDRVRQSSSLRNVTNASSLPDADVEEDIGSDANEQEEADSVKDFVKNIWSPFLQEAEDAENALKGVIGSLEQLCAMKTDLNNELKDLRSVPSAVFEQGKSKPEAIKRLRKAFEDRRKAAKRTSTDLTGLVKDTRSEMNKLKSTVVDTFKSLRN